MADRRQAFNEITGAYSSARPGYPEALWDALRAALAPLAVPHLAADVGSGTGISTRQLATALEDWQVIGIEPGDDMFQQALRDSEGSGIDFRQGDAEALPLDASAVGLVLAAQAVQWFDRPAFYREARRVLALGGLLGIIQNNRAWERSPFLDAYETFLEAHSPAYSRHYRSFDVAQELTDAGFGGVVVHRANWMRTSSHALFLEMSRSSTKMKAAVSAIGEREAVSLVEGLLEQHHPGGELDVPYTSELYLGASPGAVT